MPEKSCLNCKFGKPEEQPEGYYCNWFPTEGKEGYWSTSLICTDYKPRPEIPFVPPEVKINYKFKEAKMNIEFQGKKYGATDKPFTFHSLKIDAGNNPCPQEGIGRFAEEFGLTGMALFKSSENISLIPDMITWLTTDSDLHIPWLVEKGYLKEVVEGVKQLPKHWYKGEASGDFYFSSQNLDLIRVTYNAGFEPPLGESRDKDNWPRHVTPIPPATITEQPEPADRRPEKCVHNSGNCPNTSMSASGCGLIKTARDCPRYSEK